MSLPYSTFINRMINIITMEHSSPHLIKFLFGDLIPQIDSFYSSSVPSVDEGGGGNPPLLSLHFASKGWMVVRVDEELCFLPTGHILLTKPGQNCLLEKFPPGNNHFYTLKISPPLWEGEPYLGFSSEELNRLFQQINNHGGVILSVSSHMAHFFIEVYRLSRFIAEGGESSFQEATALIKLKNRLREILVLLSEAEPIPSEPVGGMISSLVPPKPSQKYESHIEMSINLMRSHLGESLTLLDLADGVDLSLGRFKSKFKEELGLTPLDYYTRLCIQRAMERLHDSQDSPSQISHELGYSSSQYFSSVFKKVSGLSPGEFREWSQNISEK